jgi:hypothetical protein
MPALHDAATVVTGAHVNVKAAIDDRAGNLGLIRIRVYVGALDVS